jgi:hypothetical protein
MRRFSRAFTPTCVGRLPTVLVFAGFQAVLVAWPASADVIDISPDGMRTTYDVPSVFRTEGVHPIPMPPRVLAHSVRKIVPPAPEVKSLLADAASRYAIRPDLLTAVAWRESRFQMNAISPKGAVGVMQLMDATARDLGVDRYDLSQNILGGAAYLRRMMDRFGGIEALALAAYNAGPGSVDRAGGIPPFRETSDYVGAILGAPHPTSSPILVDR